MRKLLLPFVFAILAVCLALNVLLLLQVSKLQQNLDTKVSSTEYKKGLTIQEQQFKSLDSAINATNSNVQSADSDIQSADNDIQSTDTDVQNLQP